MKRILYFIFFASLLVSSCYKDEFAQIEKEIETLRNAEIAPLAKQLDNISSSLGTLTSLSSELKEYIGQLEDASSQLQKNIDAVNSSMQSVKDALSNQVDQSQKDVLAQLETVKSALETQLSNINSVLAVLKEKYASLEQQTSSLETTLSEKYASLDWVNGTFATIESQNALISDIESIRSIISGLNSSTLKIEDEIRDFISKEVEKAEKELEAKIAGLVNTVTTGYLAAISDATKNITLAYTEDIAEAISQSESKIMNWVSPALDDYYTIAQAEAKILAYKTLIGNVPDGKSLQSQIDELYQKIEDAKTSIQSAYNDAISKAISESEGKLNKELSEAIASFRDTELKTVTGRIEALEKEVDKLWDKLGSLEGRINSLSQQIAAIENSIKVLTDTKQTLKEYVEALKKQLQDKDTANYNELKALIDALDEAADGSGNQSVQSQINALKNLIGELPEGQTSVTEWIEKSQKAIEESLKLYATIAYVDGLKKELDALVKNHSDRLDEMTTKLSTLIDDSKTTIVGWISDKLSVYYTAVEVNAKFKTLDTKLKGLFAGTGSTGDSYLDSQIKKLESEIDAEMKKLEEGFKSALEDAIKDYNGFVTSTVKSKLDASKTSLLALDGDDGKLKSIEDKIEQIQKDIASLNKTIEEITSDSEKLSDFIEKSGYSSLKDLVDAYTKLINELPTTYASLSKYNEIYGLVYGSDGTGNTSGYKYEIDKLAQFASDLEAAETSISAYKDLIGEYDLKTDKLKTIIDGLAGDLEKLKTTVFGGGSVEGLRTQLGKLETASGTIKDKLDELDELLLKEVNAFSTIVYIPTHNDGMATFSYDGTKYNGEFEFEVRPRGIASAVANKSTMQYISTPSRALNLLDFSSVNIVGDNSTGVITATVSVTDGSVLGEGASAALFASSNDYDFVSDFVPIYFPDGVDKIYVVPASINFDDGKGGEYQVKVFSSSTISLNVNSKPDWITCTKGSSTKQENMYATTYTVKASASTLSTSRVGEVEFCIGSNLTGKTYTQLSVSQVAREAQTVDGFNPASGTIKFGFNGYVLGSDEKATDSKTASVTVTTNDDMYDWTCKVDDACTWATVSKNNSQFSISVEDNSTSADRDGKIIVTSVTGTQYEYLFTQKTRAAQTLSFDPSIDSVLTLSGAKQTKDITVTSSDGETDWTVVTTGSDKSWLSCTKNGGKVTLSVDANPGAERTAGLKFTSYDGTDYECTVTQEARSQTITSVSPSTITFSADGSKYLSASGSWEELEEAKKKETYSTPIGEFSRMVHDYYYIPVTVTTSDGGTDWKLGTTGTWSGESVKIDESTELRIKEPSEITSWGDSKPTGTVVVNSFDDKSSKSVTIIQNRPLSVTYSSSKTGEYYTVTVKSDSQWGYKNKNTNISIVDISESNNNATEGTTFRVKCTKSSYRTVTIYNSEGSSITLSVKTNDIKTS